MQNDAPEIFLAGKVRARGDVELADCADEHRRFDSLFAIFGVQRRNPAPFALIPARRYQLRIEAQMLANAVLRGDLLQIVQQFLALAEITGPGVARPE